MDANKTDFCFDPRLFITPPFEDCPKCKEKKCFGVLSIYGQSYIRRCNKCWYDESYSLPVLSKKIIYIDQFVISNMMKSIHPTFRITDKNNDFFKELFLKLEFLAKAHIVVCPESLIHYDESIMSKRYCYDDIKEMYKYLSFGTSFLSISTISRFHFVAAFRKYLTGVDDIKLKRETVCPRCNEWKDKLRIDVDCTTREAYKKEICDQKIRSLEALSLVFEDWKRIRPFVFEEIFKNELTSPAKFYLKNYYVFLKEFTKAQFGIENNINRYISDEALLTVREMFNILEESQIALSRYCELIDTFFKSNLMLEVPNHRIESLLWTALARKAASGQKKIKNISIVNDIYAISSYMPYSDAIFIDKECHGLLDDVDVQKRIGCTTRVFSLKNKAEFIKYLDELILNISEEHIALIKQVYGEQWLEPFTSMYDI